MSTVSIRAALESALNGMSPAIKTAWEAHPFPRPGETAPTATDPYQEVHVLFGQPDNSVYGSEHQEVGYMQVRLMYPAGYGSSAAMARAELIRDTFPRGASFSSGGITAIISRTAEIVPPTVEDGRYAVIVRVRFYANIYN